MAAYHRVLLIFVDGIGLAPVGPDNPFGRVPMPALEGVLGGPLTVESIGTTLEAHLSAIDANLGVEGLPQSATGQTALFTGDNRRPLQIRIHLPIWMPSKVGLADPR